MVDRKLIDWIKSEEAKGIGDTALRKILLKQKYVKSDIDEAFRLIDERKLPFLVSFVLIFGLSFIILFLLVIFLSVESLFDEAVLGYILLILLSLFIGYIIYLLKRELMAKEKFGIIVSLISPLVPSIFLMMALGIIQALMKQLSGFSQDSLLSSPFALISFLKINSNIDPVISAMTFYVLCNVFMVISTIKLKEYKLLIWHVVFMILFLIAIFILYLFSSIPIF